MKSRTRSYLGHLVTKTRSLGLIKEVPCGAIGQMKELPCGCSRDNISCPNDLKIIQNVFLVKTLDEFEFGSPTVINKVTRSN